MAQLWQRLKSEDKERLWLRVLSVLVCFSVLTADAHRALELLEEYHAGLKDPADKPLQKAIERIIRIFRSRLFQALLGMWLVYEEVFFELLSSLLTFTSVLVSQCG